MSTQTDTPYSERLGRVTRRIFIPRPAKGESSVLDRLGMVIYWLGCVLLVLGLLFSLLIFRNDVSEAISALIFSFVPYLVCRSILFVLGDR